MIGMLQTFGLYLHHSDTSTYFELKENPVADVDLKPIIASTRTVLIRYVKMC